jgi:hypothetical protein
LRGVFEKWGPGNLYLARENRSRRNLHGNEEESKKEKETLTVSETISRNSRIFTGLSGEAPLERLHFGW